MNVPPSVTVALPAGDYVGVARLVAAGVATRLDLAYEAVDDLQMAIETVLRSAFDSEDNATIALSSDRNGLSVSIGPVAPGMLQRRLHEHDVPEGITLETVLGHLVDGVTMQREPLSSIVLHVDLGARAA